MTRPQLPHASASEPRAVAAGSRVLVRAPACSLILALTLGLAAGPSLPARCAKAASLSASQAAAGAPPAPQPLVQPGKDALALAEQIRARWMGVDHAGNLWAWEAVEGSLRFFSPAAERLLTISVPWNTIVVDGDAQWGAVALAVTPGPGAARREGSHLLWVRPGAAAGSQEELPLPELAGWVCWLDRDTVAVSPQRAGHLVEIWNLARRKLERSFGATPEIKLSSGVTRVREVMLRYDPERRLLYTLDSFTGDLVVFTPDGRLAWRGKVDNPDRKAGEKTLAAIDAEAKTRKMALGQVFSNLWLAAGPDGAAWVSQQVDMLGSAVRLVRANAAGATAQKVTNLRCPSRTFTIWGAHLVFFSDTPSPREVCNTHAPLPPLPGQP